jgi:Right handed beta helix region
MFAKKETSMRSSARNLQLHPFALLLFVLSFVVLTIPARAITVTVECGEGTVSKTLKSLDPQSSNTVRVVGSCQDSITIADFADLTIMGVSAGGKNSVLESLNGAPVLWIVGSHVQIKNLTISGGVYGVMWREFSVCRFSGNTIQNATGSGVILDCADATFAGDVLENNANSALNLTASRVRVTAVTVKNTTAGSWGPGQRCRHRLGQHGHSQAI